MSKSSAEINDLLGDGKKSTAPYYPAPNSSSTQNLNHDEGDYQSVFIDTLTTVDENGQEIPGAKDKVAALRKMRFKPAQRYAAQNQADAANNQDPTATYTTTNGVRFLTPMKNPHTINFKNFSNTSRVQVIENRSWWSSFKRGVSMFFQTVFTAGLGGLRLLAKMKQILPGTFGYAMNMDGDIEIYPPSTERRIGLSPWTDIKVASITEPYINIFGRIHLVNVPEGKYATAKLDRFPVFLPPGRHIIESIDFKLDLDTDKPKFHDMNAQWIKNGDSYIVRVPQGTVAFGDLSGQPQIFEPEHGTYIFHDPTFKFVYNNGNTPFENIGNKMVGGQGAVRVVTVMQTHALLSNENGELKIHRGGRHPLLNANHVCDPNKPNQEFDLTQQKILIADNHDVFISKDGVQLQVRAEMLFKVKDVEKCIKNVGANDYRNNITARAQHIIRELLKSNNYLSTGDLHGGPSAPSSSKEIVPHNDEKAQEQLIQNIGKTLRDRLKAALDEEGGIELHDVLITNLLPLSAELRKSIESNANSIAEAQRKITEADLNREIQRTMAETDRNTAMIQANKNAEVLKINTAATAEAEKIKQAGAATAAAEALRIKTDAELHIVKRTADTNAEATIKTAEADKTAHELRAKGLEAYDPTGKQIQLLEAQAKATKGLLAGAELKLIGSDVSNVGTMMMSSVAGMLFTGQGSPRPLEKTVLTHNSNDNNLRPQ